MSNINVNDIVRIGNGKVEYNVEEVYPGGVAKVRGGKNNRSQDVEVSRLAVVKPAPAPRTDDVEGAARAIAADQAQGIAQRLGDGVYTIVDGEVTKYKSFDSAAFDISRNHSYLFASIVRNGKVLVKRDRVTQAA